jgi:hypothetical protein
MQKNSRSIYILAIGAIGLSLGPQPISAQQAGAQSITQGENPFEYCTRVVTNDDPGPFPDSLLPAFERAFGSKPIGPHFRCYQGAVMGCQVGANLNCGKANTSNRSPGGDEWCRAHPNDQSIPMVATGHDTIYTWRCSGIQAAPVRKVSPVDDRGFEMMNWRVLN